MKEFKPQLITNDPIPEDLPFPRYISLKRHGICIIVHPHYDLILGRSLKPIVNKQFQERFKPILDWSKRNNILLQGEAHIDGCVSDDMVHFLNTIDLNNMSKKSIEEIEKNCKIGKFHLPKEKYYILPEELKIYLFDSLDFNNLNELYLDRWNRLLPLAQQFSETIEVIEQHEINDSNTEETFFNRAIELGYEGLVIRYNKPYKFGRSTSKEQLIYKKLPEPTFDGVIIEINQATIVDPNAEKKMNELGYSVTSKKKGDRILIDKAKDFQVEMIPEGKTEAINFGVSMAGFDDEARKEVWTNQEKYLGRMIEFKSKAYNGIGRPKSAVFIRFRDDKI